MSVLVIAAATKNNNDGENDYPCIVFVEEMAKTVVVHNICSSKMCCDFHRSLYLMPSLAFVTHKLKMFSKSPNISEVYIEHKSRA